jgi:hypothetical protein
MLTISSGALSLVSLGLSISNGLAQLVTAPYELLAPFLGQVLGTGFGGWSQAISPF